MRNIEKLQAKKIATQQELEKLKEKEAQFKASVRKKQASQRTHLLIQLGIALEFTLRGSKTFSFFDSPDFISKAFPKERNRNGYKKALYLIRSGHRLDFLADIPAEYQLEVLEDDTPPWHHEQKEETLH